MSHSLLFAFVFSSFSSLLKSLVTVYRAKIGNHKVTSEEQLSHSFWCNLIIFRQTLRLYSVRLNYYATATDSLNCATSAAIVDASSLITNPCSRQNLRTCHRSSVVPSRDVRTNSRIDKRPREFLTRLRQSKTTMHNITNIKFLILSPSSCFPSSLFSLMPSLCIDCVARIAFCKYISAENITLVWAFTFTIPIGIANVDK